jgi:hypothetical protein
MDHQLDQQHSLFDTDCSCSQISVFFCDEEFDFPITLTTIALAMMHVKLSLGKLIQHCRKDNILQAKAYNYYRIVLPPMNSTA